MDDAKESSLHINVAVLFLYIWGMEFDICILIAKWVSNSLLYSCLFNADKSQLYLVQFNSLVYIWYQGEYNLTVL